MCDHDDMKLMRIGADESSNMMVYGWYAHYVGDQDDVPFRINYHTHGIQESFGHKDFQICLPVHPYTMHAIINSMVEEIKAGKKFEPLKKYGNIIGGGFLITFKEAVEHDRQVLRVIFPDDQGSLDPNVMGELSKQWD